MDIFKTIKRLFTVLLLLSFFSFTALPITTLIGISPPSQLIDVTEFAKLATIFIFAAIIITILLMLGLGYFALTGWQNYKAAPKILRLFLAFILGYVIFTIAGPIALLIPAPIIPVIIAAILIWIVLRSISSLVSDKSPCPKHNVNIEGAIAQAKAFLNKIYPSAGEVEIQESKIIDGKWEVLLFAKKTGEKYEIKIDGSSGGIISWAKA